jgi:1-aminocyclopropane-1-carboxylate deaminase/D-cysteine desulfhydrase-like pyridoxal-dependent ACC family enzyme
MTSKLEKFLRLQFGHYPMPIEELPRLHVVLGTDAPRLFITRDD